MSLRFDVLFNEIKPSLDIEPVWASKIKRWSQLDQESFVVAEATHRCLDFFGSPDQLILLSTQGSNQTDFLFAHSNKISPSYFVHTLPNVRSLVFSNLSGWEGTMFCFSQGKYSLVKFLNEAIHVHQNLNTLVMNVNRVGDVYQCDFYKIGREGKHELRPIQGLDDFGFREQIRNT